MAKHKNCGSKKSDSRGSYNDGGGGKIAKSMRHHMYKNKLWRK